MLNELNEWNEIADMLNETLGEEWTTEPWLAALVNLTHAQLRPPWVERSGQCLSSAGEWRLCNVVLVRVCPFWWVYNYFTERKWTALPCLVSGYARAGCVRKVKIILVSGVLCLSVSSFTFFFNGKGRQLRKRERLAFVLGYVRTGCIRRVKFCVVALVSCHFSLYI